MSIPTQWPQRGDLVKGHRVFAYAPGLPAIPATVVEATETTITIETSTLLSILGLPKRSVWTWRRKLCRFQQKGTGGEKSMSLLLDRRPRAKPR